MNNKPHPHAEVLRAIADGVPLSEFELRHRGWSDVVRYVNMVDGYTSWMYTPDDWLIHRKQRQGNAQDRPGGSMNNEINTGGPAFPIHWENHNEGATLRDYFAAKALPSILAPNPATGQYAQIDDFPACAVVAYAMADAMIKARNNK